MNSSDSSLLLNVALSGANLEVHVPFHLRYGELSLDGHQSAEISMPDAFFSCPTSRKASIADSDYLPWPPELTSILGASRERARIDIHSESAVPVLVTVPVGNLQDLPVVEAATAATMMVCFCCLAYVFHRTWTRLDKLARSKVE